jgi:hypothetical protein
VPIRSVWVRGIEKVDIVSGIQYFPGAPFAGKVWDSCLGEAGGRKGVPEGVRLGAAVAAGSVDIRGKEGENTEAGLFGGRRCRFL